MLSSRPVSAVRPAQRPQSAPSTERRIGMGEVAKHDRRDDGWIVVNTVVYDITNFVKFHPGWDFGGSTSTALAIERALGTDCTEEFHDVHDAAQAAMLAPYAIGTLDDEEEEGTLLASLPRDLLDRVCLVLGAASLGRAAACCRGLREHARRYGALDDAKGSAVFLPYAVARWRPSVFAHDAPKNGVRVVGRRIEAAASCFSLHRVVEMPEALRPGCLFQVRVVALATLTLDVGVSSAKHGKAGPGGGRVEEWYVDGAGRAVRKTRGREGDVASFAYGVRVAPGDVVGVRVDRDGALGFRAGKG